MGNGVNMSFNDSESANQFMADRKTELINLAESIVSVGANVVLSLKDIDPVRRATQQVWESTPLAVLPLLI